MPTQVELDGRDALIEHCRNLVRRHKFTFEPAALLVKPYVASVSTRIGWDQTYVVVIQGYGVIGFTDTEC